MYLPSPLAEIAAQRANEQVRDSGAKRFRKSRPRRPTAGGRRRMRRSKRPGLAYDKVIVGTLAGINDSGQPLVHLPFEPSGRAMLAWTTVPLTAEHIERELVIVFESSDIERPIVLGVLSRPDDRHSAEPAVTQTAASQLTVEASQDGARLVLTAQDEIVLRCGEASLTLTRGGKVLLRGAYVLSHSSGINRIRGGAVQIN
jgi:hypothetical protein